MKKSIFSPYATWKNFFKSPTTVRYPKEDIDVFEKEGASPNYRGLHSNDLELCIGCGTCEKICPTAAITMVKGDNTGEGKKGVIPRIDYGRCCYCAFCVDICSSRSLIMSRDYIHTVQAPLDKIGIAEVKRVREDFIITPGREHSDNPGYATPDELSWLDLQRVKMAELKVKNRTASFIEIVKGFSRTQAIKEASRCVECEVCVESCPANMEIPQYIRAIWEHDLKKSVDIMYKTNPLPGACGRICTHKCETVCSISLRGEPVAIRWLKRYAVDSLPEDEYRQILKKEIVPKNKRVAVVGSGPAGLAAAYYLSLAGYQVTIFEALSQAGGMMRVGAPAYRLPDQALDRDIDHVLSLGTELRLNTRVGKDIALAELKKKYDAVYISTGLHLGRGLKFEAEKLPYVRQSIDLLRECRLAAKGPWLDRIPEHMTVIGGGNVALDIARTMARLQKQKFGKVKIDLLCLESREEMPADEEEIIEGMEEGIKVHPSYGPKDIVVEKGRVTGVEFIKCLSVFDEEGRFSPKFDEGQKLTIETGYVVESIGQGADISYIPEKIRKQLEFTPAGQFKVNEDGQTSLPWLFAGGDIVRGPDIITAVADGHLAARGIDRYLSG